MPSPFLVSRRAYRGIGIFTATMLSVAPSMARAADAPAKVAAAGNAPQLVQAALDAELAGDTQRRSALLADAVAADPDFAPARWQSGQLKFDGQWLTPTQIQNLVSHHHRWTDYRKLRDSLTSSPAYHETLAVWCQENGLANEERYHWANVLVAKPSHKLARERLGLEVYHGGLFTHEQVAQFEQQTKDASTTLERLKPKFAKLCRDAAGADEALRSQALAQLRAIDDPAAMEALEQAVRRQSGKTSAAAVRLNLALITALGNMPQYEATLRLVNHAVYNPLEEVRRVAAMSLKTRPQTDYVPLLMAALTAPIELETDVVTGADGSVHMNQTFRQEGADADARHTRSVNFETDGVLSYDPSRNNPGDVLARHLARAAAIAADAERRIAVSNAQAQALNERIEMVLQAAAEYRLESDHADEWWTAWQDYNELQSPSEKLVVDSHEERTSVYTYFQGSPELLIQGDMRPSAEPTRRRSCFKAGTMVWTQAGPAPIETIRIGDFVLSQHPETGELAYRAVLMTTVGQPTTVVRLQFPGESIVATLGHRFWVNGRGWEMTKFLAPDNPIHTLGGPTKLVSLTPEPDKIEAYNLIVDEFHTYFVGDSKILVHDNGCPLPALAAVPGSATVRAPAQPHPIRNFEQVANAGH